MSGMLKAYDAVILRVKSMTDERSPIDRMSDEDFVNHRARVLVEKNKPDAPFVITPVQWLDKVAQVEVLLATADEHIRRAEDAEKRAFEAEATRDDWHRLYEETKVSLAIMETDRNLYRTANSLAENAIHELVVKLSTTEAQVLHLRKVYEARSLPSPPVEE